MSAAPPTSLTTFVGREQEVAAIRTLLGATRLLTLTGAGGSGKTRLASEVAQQAAAEFPDGVIWVELAPLHDAEFLPGYVFAALGNEQGTRPALEALIDGLRDRVALLVLDNCEHLVDACARLAETLLLACPRLRIFATSREALGVGGERAWLIPGLSLPGLDDAGASLAATAASEAVRLFVDRAQAAVATFELTAANAPAIARICRRLDGLPLAIELAAARVRTLPPEQLAARLEESLRVLGGGPRTAVPRHRTLREAIDWSHDLLDDEERALLRTLSVFAGEFSLESAESVCAGADVEPTEIVDVLGALVDKSLVVMREADGTARYHLLETIRQYARERLEESGRASEVCRRHAATFLALASQAAPHFITRDRRIWIDRVLRELDNVRVALAWTREHDVEMYLRFSGMLGWFWYSTGLWAEGRRWLEEAIALSASAAPSAARAATLLGAGVLSSLQAQTALAIPWLEESAAISRALGDRAEEAYALAYIGVAYGQTGDPRTVEPIEAALAWFRQSGDLYGLRLALVVSSTYSLVRGDLARAREVGEEGARLAREFGLDRELAISLQVLATAVMAQGELARADALFREALAALRRDPSIFWTARALHLLGWVAFRRKQHVRGARLLGTAQAYRSRIGALQLPHDRDRLAPDIAAARAAVGDAAYDRAFAEGLALPLDEAMDEVLKDDVSAAPTASAAPVAPDVAPPLDVRALGALEILRDGAPLPDDAWRYARPRELLLYLLAHPEGRTREQIGLVFWPEASATQVKNSFHVTLHHVRKAIGRPELITFDGERYRVAWELGVRFDARRFEEMARPALRALRSSRANGHSEEALGVLREALRLYRGDFLEAEGAGDWHLELRDHLRRLFTESLLLVAARALRAESWSEAAELYRRAIAADSLLEEAHRGLMAALARAGDRGQAMRQYERLATLLRSELDAAPDGETTALYDRLRRAEAV